MDQEGGSLLDSLLSLICVAIAINRTNSMVLSCIVPCFFANNEALSNRHSKYNQQAGLKIIREHRDNETGALHQ